MLIALPVILAAVGLSTLFAPVAVMYGAYRVTFLLGGLISLVAFVMEAAALPGLFKRSQKGWYLVYYAVLVGAVGQLLEWQIISLIINVVISMYFLFEIKEYYK
jgi:hypothetical protein